MRILNFHDLGESGENACYNELLKYWRDEQIVSNTYDLATRDPASILFDSMAEGPYDLIVGTGFGGVLALIAGRATGVRTVLVNPMYPVRRYLPEELPNYEHAKELARYEHGKICWDTDRKSLRNVHLILSRDDDITDTARTPAYFRPGNSHFVEGGHFPDGEDFKQAFAWLTGGMGMTEYENAAYEDIVRESQALEYLEQWFGSGEDSPDLLYLYGPEQRLMTHDARRLVWGEGNSLPSYDVRFISADELPEAQEGLREAYRDIGLLAVDNIRKSLLTEVVKKSLWVACDEVVRMGGKVLLVSDDHPAAVFEDDDPIMEVIWSGEVRECLDWSRYGGKGGLVIDLDSWSSCDHRPYSEYARHMRIDDVDTSDGHIVVYWSCPGENEKEHALYLYYADGKWRRDEEDGYGDEGVAAMVLSKASGRIIAQAESADHDAKGFWGWGW